MNPRLLLAALVSLVLAWDAKAQSPEDIEIVYRQRTLGQLRGQWVPEFIVTTEGAKPYPVIGRSLHFLENNQFARLEGDNAIVVGKLTLKDYFLHLDAESKLPWDAEAAPVREKSRYAFRVEGDLLTLCWSAGDKGKSDDLSPGEGRMVVVYKRRKTDGKLSGIGR